MKFVKLSHFVVDEIDKPNIDASSTGKELFINGIGKTEMN